MLTASMDRLTDLFDERSGKPITEDRLTPSAEQGVLHVYYSEPQ